MKTQSLFKIDSWGEIPPHVKSIISKYDGQPANKDTIFTLDQDIAFCVCTLGVAHGNLSKGSHSAWLSPRNGDNSFNVNIAF